jgi:hypothetical protein
MASADSALVPQSRATRWARMVLKVLVGTMAFGFVGSLVPGIWNEWQALQTDRARIRETQVIGYIGVTPNPSYAAKPERWIEHEGETTRIWACWEPSQGHVWFRFNRGDLDTRQLGYPMGRDAVRAIDKPLIESQGGERWERIPFDADVISLEHEGVATAYPVRLLKLAQIVNDESGTRPILLLHRPNWNEESAFELYDRSVAGEPVSMGSSGHFLDKSPLLYDHKTESLWTSAPDGLTAVTGPLKGTSLKRISKPTPIAWSTWKSQFPKGRLVIGADRTDRSSLH